MYLSDIYTVHANLSGNPAISIPLSTHSNGMPIGACLAKDNIAEILQPGDHGSTYGGNPAACAAANAVMDTILTENLCQHAADMGQYLAHELTTAFAGKNSVVDIRQKGLLIGIELDYACGDLVRQAAAKSLLINVTANNVIRLLPPLIITNFPRVSII